jgi:hypothetical protein
MVATTLAIEFGEALQRRIVERAHNSMERCVQTQSHGWRQLPTPKVC